MLVLKDRPLLARHQYQGLTPQTLTRILEDQTNLAVWQRRLPVHIADFAQLVLSLNEPLAESLCLELADEDAEPDLAGLAAGLRDLQGFEGFMSDLKWLISAFACLLGARRIGVRLRVLDKAMCPRFHVDHVPVRLITLTLASAANGLRRARWIACNLARPMPNRKVQRRFASSTAATSRCSKAKNGTAMKASA